LCEAKNLRVVEQGKMSKAWPCFTITAVFLFTALLVPAQKQSGTAAAGNAEHGKTFFQRDCAVCHSVGRGNQIGPDLLGVTRRRSHRWLVTMIQRPDQLLNQHDPIALALVKKYTVRMPDLRISSAECDDLIAYLESETAAHERTAAKK
jgi:protein SCO1